MRDTPETTGTFFYFLESGLLFVSLSYLFCVAFKEQNVFFQILSLNMISPLRQFVFSDFDSRLKPQKSTKDIIVYSVLSFDEFV